MSGEIWQICHILDNSAETCNLSGSGPQEGAIREQLLRKRPKSSLGKQTGFFPQVSMIKQKHSRTFRSSYFTMARLGLKNYQFSPDNKKHIKNSVRSIQACIDRCELSCKNEIQTPDRNRKNTQKDPILPTQQPRVQPSEIRNDEKSDEYSIRSLNKKMSQILERKALENAQRLIDQQNQLSGKKAPNKRKLQNGSNESAAETLKRKKRLLQLPQSKGDAISDDENDVTKSTLYTQKSVQNISQNSVFASKPESKNSSYQAIRMQSNRNRSFFKSKKLDNTLENTNYNIHKDISNEYLVNSQINHQGLSPKQIKLPLQNMVIGGQSSERSKKIVVNKYKKDMELGMLMGSLGQKRNSKMEGNLGDHQKALSVDFVLSKSSEIDMPRDNIPFRKQVLGTIIRNRFLEKELERDRQSQEDDIKQDESASLTDKRSLSRSRTMRIYSDRNSLSKIQQLNEYQNRYQNIVCVCEKESEKLHKFSKKVNNTLSRILKEQNQMVERFSVLFDDSSDEQQSKPRLIQEEQSIY